MSDFSRRWGKIDRDGAEFLRFRKVENKRSQRSDIHAFLLLDELFPGEDNIVSYSARDEIWLSIGLEQAETLSDEQILELSRSGVSWDSDSECLKMYT